MPVVLDRVHRCALCETTQVGLLRCGGCRLVRYCCRDHQVQHRSKHKKTCKTSVELRNRLEEEEDLVRHATPDFMTPANAFDTHIGHFWGVVTTRDYMQARFELADYAVGLRTLDGVREGLDHYKDMIRLNRSDNMGLRDRVPALMLRLDQDQQCYDFIKWYATGPDDNYDWGDMSLPFLNIRDADVLEDPAFLVREWGSLNHQVAIQLLKMKMLIDIRQLKIVKKVLRGRLPVELWNLVEQEAVRSPLSSRFVGNSYTELVKTEHMLSLQCRKLGVGILDTNGGFTYELLECNQETLDYRPEAYCHGSYEERALAVQNCYAAWQETAGALELLKDARSCAARNSENEVQTYLKHDRDGRTPEQMLSDLSVNRIWGYLEYAIHNGSYLGPPEDRPSERYYREARALAEEEGPDRMLFSDEESD
ncbi:hypothetical protein DM02DRAFT_719922 [Periconia macrospinosa]|uniref:MYND-type domain-containing protein n=1 Tax=Periconia macrospinosa TaxID=97972 RepID=A0A2V1DGP4_9PLEO|nr:hypothetical protein DM02DRAFT_719922 [Periconia macrospinosa]